jgi:hypothetical protein
MTGKRVDVEEMCAGERCVRTKKKYSQHTCICVRGEVCADYNVLVIGAWT